MASKITQLTQDTSPSSDDLIVTVDNPSGAAANKKVTISDLFAHAPDITATGLTVPSISPAANFALNQNSVAVITSVGSGAIANTLYLKEGKVGIGTTGPYNKLQVSQNIAETAAMSINSTAVAKLSNPNNTAGNLTLLEFAGPDNDISILLGSRLVNASNGNSAFVVGARNGSSVLTEQLTMLGNGNVGIGTTSPNSTLHNAGSFAVAFAAKTANYTVTATDCVLTSDATAGTVTFTLPTAVGIAGRRYTFKRIDASANSTVIDGAGSETIDGATTKTLGAQWSAITVISNGVNWLVESQLGTIS